MRAVVLIRSGSFHAWTELAVRSGPESGSGSLPFLRRSPSVRLSPRSFALHVGPKENGNISSSLLLRARSEADLVTRTYRPARVAEEEEEYSNGGMGKGTKVGGGGGRSGEGGDHNNRRIGDYYQEMLRSDPGNPLLLRNYGQFLHEVERDAKKAEEFYGRAILASPGDGEVLSLYGRLVWETQGEKERAEGYFERAVEASPQDCYVLGSYASFLWDAADEEEDSSSPPLVEAF
ncbi:uncharacterized protein [Typha latifolia]|uniref:uncharacterized protein isoform X2 n=1 Tax=Typha latifolia TaxID=4733 RepID=UPI003C2FEF7E